LTALIEDQAAMGTPEEQVGGKNDLEPLKIETFCCEAQEVGIAISNQGENETESGYGLLGEVQQFGLGAPMVVFEKLRESMAVPRQYEYPSCH
jgi:hypothetical protein